MPRLLLAAIALLPIIAISLLGRHYALTLEGIAPIDLTNFSALRSMVRGVIESSGTGDSWIPMREALNILHSDQPQGLYEKLFFAGKIRFQYPLTSLVPLELLSVVGLTSLKELNLLNFTVYCFNAIAVSALAWLLFRKTPTLDKKPSMSAAFDQDAAFMTALAFIASLLFYPLIRAVVLGQIQVWIDALFTLAVLCWLIERRALSGIFIGFALAIKPQIALLLVWGILWRQKQFCIGILLISVPVVLASLLLYGFSNNFGYLDVLAFLSKHGESFFANNSINGILNGYFSPNDSHFWDDSNLTPFVAVVYVGTMVASLVSIALIVIPPMVRRPGAEPTAAMLGAAAICTVIGSPVAWEHHYGILLPIYLIAVRDAWLSPAGRYRAVIFVLLSVSWILVANIIPFAVLAGNSPFSFIQAHCFFGALLLLGILFAEQKLGNSRQVVELANQAETAR